MRIRHIPRRIRSLITIFLLTVFTFIIHAHLNEEREKKKSGSDTDKNQTMPFQRLSLSGVLKSLPTVFFARSMFRLSFISFLVQFGVLFSVFMLVAHTQCSL